MKCPTCRAQMNSRRENYKYEESGLSNIVLADLEVLFCPECGTSAPVITAIEDLHKAIALTIADEVAKLSGEQVRFLRKYLGFSGSDFARTIGVKPETVSRWENGKEPMGATAERLLRLMVERETPVTEYPIKRLAEIADPSQAPRPFLKMARGPNWGAVSI